MSLHWPKSAAEWGSILVGLSAVIHGVGMILTGHGDTSAYMEIAAGLGTMGLPDLSSLFGPTVPEPHHPGDLPERIS